MTEHVSNEQVAEAIGWKRKNDCLIANKDFMQTHKYLLDGECSFFKHKETGDYWFSEVPRWTTDLNLVREIENTLTESEWDLYIMRGVLPDGKRKILNITPTEYLDNFRLVCNATAQQKCDAIFPILQARHDA